MQIYKRWGHRGELAPPLHWDSQAVNRGQGEGDSVKATADQQVPMGVGGLDEVLDGGLPAGRLYLVQGTPGAGKTTVGLQFLLEGVRTGERAMYITLSETVDEIQ